jgi:predicted ArsR family transcriptional regulator
MKNTCHVTHGKTMERIERIRSLITAMRACELMREEIAGTLQLGPSGVRKYIADLRADGVIELARYADGTATFLGHPVYRLALDADGTAKYLAALAAGAIVRKVSKSSAAVAMVTPGRHFHILADDTHYAIRVNRAPIVRDPLVAHLFGAAK